MASKRRRRTGPPPRPATKPHRPRFTTGPATRAQQRAAAAQRRKRARLRRLVVALLLVAALGAVAAYVVTSRSADASLREALTAGTCEVDTGRDEMGGGDGHVESPSYAVDGMSTQVAATARGQRLLCGEVAPAGLDRFAEQHVGDGPEDVERGWTPDADG